MYKIIYLFTISLILLSVCLFSNDNIILSNESKDSLFYYNTLIDITDGGYHLSFYISTTDFSGKVVVNSRSLFYLLYKTKYETSPEIVGNDTSISGVWNKSRKYYVDMMHKLLMNNDTLKIDYQFINPDLKYRGLYYGFYPVTVFDEIEITAEQGVDIFLDKYFTNFSGKYGEYGEIKSEFYESMENNEERMRFSGAIIDKLFQWRIYTSNRQTDGNLRYSRQGPPKEIKERWEQGLYD